MISFSVPGTPVGKGRPKFARRGNFVTTYTPEKTASYENLVKLHAGSAMKAQQPISFAVCCVINIEVIPPSSWSNKKRMAALCGDTRPTSKPDLDNVAKGIFDAMNGIVWLDDKQVVEMVVRKRYSERAQAVVEVRAL
jgi:Holliday junction resolvase RusA-like endonuclease